MTRIEIFKEGTHRSSEGLTRTWSHADLEAIARVYDPEVHEAPLVVGHPRDNAPAYGWVKALEVDGDRLVARTHQVAPEFAELVKAGRFKKRSASFYGPKHPANPVPGSWYLRHVGFLGAQPPAVKGLRDARFGDEGGEVVTVEIEFTEEPGAADGPRFGEPAWTLARVLRRLREWLIGREGLETADRVIPEYQVEALRALGKEPGTEAAGPAPAFAEEDEMITKEQHEEALRRAREEAAREAQARFSEAAEKLKAREEELARREAELQRAEVAEFVEGLVEAGKVLPADRGALVAFLAGDETVSFSEGDETRSVPRHEWFRGWLERLPRLVDYAEHGAGEDPPEADPVAVAKRAQEYVETQRAKGVEVSYAEAVAHVTRTSQA